MVAASLPGYGFSEGAAKPGMGTANIATIFRELMKRLGFERFYVQGGDWGSYVVRNLATLYPDDVLGLHTNFGVSTRKISVLKTWLGSFWPTLVVDEKYVDRMYPLSRVIKGIVEESGYFHLQATKPDSIGMNVL